MVYGRGMEVWRIGLSEHTKVVVSSSTRTCFYHLRQLRVIRRSLTVETAHSLVRALVHSRLDYCNGVLAGMHQYQYDRLQSVLRAAARLVLRLPKWASVSECYIFFVAPIICMVCNVEDNLYGGSGLSTYCSMVLDNKLRAVL